MSGVGGVPAPGRSWARGSAATTGSGHPDDAATSELLLEPPQGRSVHTWTPARPRAIPSLVHVLKYDSSKDVRIASAIALGEIGGSDFAVALERCAIYDKKEDVRKAATTALERLNAQAKNSPPRSSPGRYLAPTASRPPVTSTPSPFHESPPPPLEPPGIDPPPADAAGSQPPPPPTPVTAGPGPSGT